MNRKRVCFSLFAAALFSFGAQAASLIFQNSANYSGCEDSYLLNLEPQTNFGDADTLNIQV